MTEIKCGGPCNKTKDRAEFSRSQASKGDEEAVSQTPRSLDTANIDSVASLAFVFARARRLTKAKHLNLLLLVSWVTRSNHRLPRSAKVDLSRFLL